MMFLGMPSDWDRFAPSYGRQVVLERSALRSLLRLLSIKSGERVLDVATGPAVLLAELSKDAQHPRVAVGVDGSPEMLARAPALPAGWDLRVADATRLPFDDESFDVVTASYLLHVMKPLERAAAIAEIARVVRPGGRVGTITIAPPQSLPMKRIWAPFHNAAIRSDGRLAGLRSLDPAPELEAAGLRVIATKRSFRGYPSLCIASIKGPDA